MVVMPAVNFLFGTRAVPPSMTLGTVISSFSRIFIFRKYIDWKIIKWFLPTSIVGAIAGAYASAQVEAEWLALIIALFLIASALWYLLGGEKINFKVRLWHFSLAGLLVSFLSGLIGGVGPLINILYLQYGDTKERIVATRAAGEILVHVVKLFAYYYFGSFDREHLFIGFIIGLTAVVASIIGKYILKKISKLLFKRLTIGIIVSSAIIMVYQSRDFLFNLLDFKLLNYVVE